jgi:hypothetical protein
VGHRVSLCGETAKNHYREEHRPGCSRLQLPCPSRRRVGAGRRTLSLGSPDRLPDLRCVPQPLDTPGYSGRRNCNMNLDDSRWDRPGLDGEPKQARGIPRNLQLDETVVMGWGGYGGVRARCGGNGWGECGEAIGIFGWERNLGVENRRRHEDLRTVTANARFASPRATVRPCNGGHGSVYDLHALPTRDIGHRTSA